jgi:hypothetical protein
MKWMIVYVDSGWILSRIAQRIYAVAPPGSWLQPLGEVASIKYHYAPDVVLYVDVQGCWHPEWKEKFPTAQHIGFFTHVDQDNFRTLYPRWKAYLELDGIVHMCQRYADMFAAAGYPAERQRVIPAADVNHWAIKPLRLGVFQRGGFPGKGDGFLQAAMDVLPTAITSHVRLYLKGTGWTKSTFRPDLHVTVDITEGYQSYQAAYDAVDYVLIPSLWEGGPMGFVEALAQGRSIIAADVGWVKDIGGAEHVFPPGDEDALAHIIESLIQERTDRRDRVAGLSYMQWMEDATELISTLLPKGEDYAIA